MTDVDDYIDDFSKDKYVRWWLFLHRLSAHYQSSFKTFIDSYPLYCTYDGTRYRVVFASRMGDIGITSNFEKETYDKRVDLDACTDFSKEP